MKKRSSENQGKNNNNNIYAVKAYRAGVFQSDLDLGFPGIHAIRGMVSCTAAQFPL